MIWQKQKVVLLLAAGWSFSGLRAWNQVSIRCWRLALVLRSPCCHAMRVLCCVQYIWDKHIVVARERPSWSPHGKRSEYSRRSAAAAVFICFSWAHICCSRRIITSWVIAGKKKKKKKKREKNILKSPGRRGMLPLTLQRRRCQENPREIWTSLQKRVERYFIGLVAGVRPLSSNWMLCHQPFFFFSKDFSNRQV